MLESAAVALNFEPQRGSTLAVFLHRLGLVLVFAGLCLAGAGTLVMATDAAAWLITGVWQSTSLLSLYGAPAVHPFTSGQALKLGLWIQPVWLLMIGLGALVALLGSVLLRDGEADDR